jgi:hypothetical protein
MFTLTAKFIGRNGSLGYVTGKNYPLTVRFNTIQRKDGTGICAYDSIESFFSNWLITAGIPMLNTAPKPILSDENKGTNCRCITPTLGGT